MKSADQLREAAETDQVSKLKGFGQKTQQAMLDALDFTDQSRGKLLYPQAEELAHDLLARLRSRARHGAGRRERAKCAAASKPSKP